MKTHYVFFVIFFLGMLFISACSQQSSTTVEDTQTGCTKDAKVCPDGSVVGRVPPDCNFSPCPGGESDSSIEEDGAEQVKTFTLTAKKWDFIPSTISVKKGDTVKLKIESIDVSHGFALPDFGINERLEPGDIVEIEFVADKTGTFTFFCSVQCGSGHSGIKGKLVVE